MISICIPTYNLIPIEFLKELSSQIDNNNIEAEILLLDDASDNFNDSLFDSISHIKHVKTFRNSTNLGRSKSRNKLADIAKYNYLLFIDSDSETVNNNFLKNYIAECKLDIVCCGGTLYKDKLDNPNQILRYKYGRKIESKSVEKRNANPWKSFTTHHFLIDKKLFQSFPQESTIGTCCRRTGSKKIE